MLRAKFPRLSPRRLLDCSLWLLSSSVVTRLTSIGGTGGTGDKTRRICGEFGPNPLAWPSGGNVRRFVPRDRASEGRFRRIGERDTT